jgi:anti-sigma B factor antagonist
MRITTQDYNDITVVELNGEFTTEFVSFFDDSIQQVISRGQAGIVLDMSNVGFIDSAGLEALLALHDRCHDENTRAVKLAAMDENCAKILEVTRLAGEFDTYEELAQAVKSFA